MAQRSLPTVPSRIFTRKPSLASRMLGAGLLLLCLLVATAGLARYLDRVRDAATITAMVSPPPPAVFAATAAVTPPVATPGPAAVADAALPSPAPVEPAPATVEPQASDVTDPAAPAAAPADLSAAGSSAPLVAREPQQVATLEAPAVMQPALDATGRYWVEYGVYVGDDYARRLQQSLADHGLAASLVATHAPGGRALIRVRSVALADYAEAREVAERAQHALGIGPLVHRSAVALAQAPPAVPVASATIASDQRYWVQFGAFPRARQAARVSAVLRRSGIDTLVATAHAARGRRLFLVRSTGLPDHASAVALAHRGQRAGNPDVLVGRTSEQRRSAIAAPSRLAAREPDDERLTSETVRR